MNKKTKDEILKEIGEIINLCYTPRQVQKTRTSVLKLCQKIYKQGLKDKEKTFKKILEEIEKTILNQKFISMEYRKMIAERVLKKVKNKGGFE